MTQNHNLFANRFLIISERLSQRINQNARNWWHLFQTLRVVLKHMQQGDELPCNLSFLREDETVEIVTITVKIRRDSVKLDLA